MILIVKWSWCLPLKTSITHTSSTPLIRCSPPHNNNTRDQSKFMWPYAYLITLLGLTRGKREHSYPSDENHRDEHTARGRRDETPLWTLGDWGTAIRVFYSIWRGAERLCAVSIFRLLRRSLFTSAQSSAHTQLIWLRMRSAIRYLSIHLLGIPLIAFWCEFDVIGGVMSR